MTKRPYVLCDIDHTLSNAFHRDIMIGGEGGWDAYHAASEHDEPLHDVVMAVKAMRALSFTVIGFTARPGKWRQLTSRWLLKHDIELDELLMRPDSDYRQSAELKMALALERFGSEQEIRDQVCFVLEDHEGIATAFRGIGVTVLQVFGRIK